MAERGWTDMFGALQEREFDRLLTGQVVATIGETMVPVALAFAVLDMTDSPTDVGIVLAAGVVPVVLFLLLGGVWADRLPRQRVMMGADLVRAALQAVLAVLLLSGQAAVAEIVVLQAARGTAEAFFRPAITGLIPQTLSPVRLQQGNALINLSQSVGTIAGSALGGLIVVEAGAGWAIAVAAGAYLVRAGFLAFLHPRPTAARTSRRAFFSELAAGWRAFRSRAWLWVLVVEFSVFGLAVYAPVMVLGPVVAREALGGAATWGFVIASGAAGMLAGAVIAMRVRPRRPLRLAGAAMVVTVVPLALLAGGEHRILLIATASLAGAALALFQILWQTALQEHVPQEELS
ncbi:MAG TPA: MFS transporter, partial [Thermoleophilia bacterium]|nr:MFS transporter [Thermoleophilia bacterium]